jgi:hypothetical protein
LASCAGLHIRQLSVSDTDRSLPLRAGPRHLDSFRRLGLLQLSPSPRPPPPTASLLNLSNNLAKSAPPWRRFNSSSSSEPSRQWYGGGLGSLRALLSPCSSSVQLRKTPTIAIPPLGPQGQPPAKRRTSSTASTVSDAGPVVRHPPTTVHRSTSVASTVSAGQQPTASLPPQLLEFMQSMKAQMATLLDGQGAINHRLAGLDTRVAALETTPPPTARSGGSKRRSGARGGSTSKCKVGGGVFT